MSSLLIVVCLCITPFDSQQTNHLIQQLGSSKFDQREEAQQKLSEMDYQIIPLLRKNKNHKDAEISFRIRILLNDFKPQIKDPIWFLPKELKKNGIMSKKYEEARLLYNQEGKKNKGFLPVPKHDIKNEEVGKLATFILLQEKIEKGELSRQECEKTIHKMSKIKTMVYNYYKESITKQYGIVGPEAEQLVNFDDFIPFIPADIDN